MYMHDLVSCMMHASTIHFDVVFLFSEIRSILYGDAQMSKCAFFSAYID